MDKITRRSFLKQAGLLGVGAVIANVPVTTGGEQILLGNDGTLFFQGEVIEISTPLVIIRDKGAEHRLICNTESRIWKGEIVSIAALEVGDFLYCRGIPLADGQIAVTKIWSNIANVYGCITEASSELVTLRIRESGDPERMFGKVRLHPGTLVNDLPRSGQRFGENTWIQVVGVVEKDGTLRATRVWTG